MHNFLRNYRLPKLIPLKLESLINSIFIEETEKFLWELPPKNSPVPDRHNLCEKNFKTDLKDPKVDLNNGKTPLAFGQNSTLYKDFSFPS